MNWPVSIKKDPRSYQIGILSSFLIAGGFFLDFDLRWLVALATLMAATITQWVATRLVHLPRFDPKSALISSLSLALLLRTELIWVGLLAGFVAIASKFILRFNNKHIFNPANFGLVVAMLVTPYAWVSPGQWGSVAIGALLITSLGLIVLHRAKRADISFAFLGAFALIHVTRAVWLGDPMTIPWHHLQSGALLVFAFFMISDPKTSPDSRMGRIFYACFVATVAAVIQFVFHKPNGPIWALVMCAPLVPLIDIALASQRVQTWRTIWSPILNKETLMKSGIKPRNATLLACALIVGAVGVLGAPNANAFCGFYVARADTELYNQASQVVLVRDEDRTVLTMSNDFQGDVEDFAIVIPVPTFIERGQINVADQALIDHLDAYTAPRLVEYFDEDPCMLRERRMMEMSVDLAGAAPSSVQKADKLGVTIEAKYTVGEYDILILSAEESSGLIKWLKKNDYKIPSGAESVVSSYLKRGMRFFVAKVNLEEHSKLGVANLRPIQVAYESDKFMLPIRLGMVNAKGAQELFVYALTRTGRVETTNYRTVRLPTGGEIPPFVKAKFGEFYRDMFTQQVDNENNRGVFLEYAWDMAWCDPCAADPLSSEQLRKLGVFWIEPQPETFNRGRRAAPQQAADVFVTRLHLRYDNKHFPEDVMFQETGDRSNFQGRYVMRHPWLGKSNCEAAKQYRVQLAKRQEKEAATLANLTGWDINDIRSQMTLVDPIDDPINPPTPTKNWWERLWD